MQSPRPGRYAIHEAEGMDRGRVVAVAPLRALHALFVREDGGADRDSRRRGPPRNPPGAR